jgi:AraC family transcriptional regulator
MHINDHSREKYITGHNLETSRNLGWDRVLAETWQHNAGPLNDVCPKATEVAVMLSGNVKVRRRGNGELQETVGIPGTIWLCPAGILEQDLLISGTIKECMHLYIDPSSIAAAAMEEFDIDPRLANLHYIGGFQDPMVEHIARTIKQEMAEPCAASGLLIDSMRTTLSTYLLFRYSSIRKRSSAPALSEGALDARRLARVRNYIRANLHQPMSLSELANEACLSPYHFSRAFKKATGLTPIQFVTHEKIETAKRLIAANTASFVEIALSIGFSSQEHFIRTFKAVVGITPGKYKAMLN